MIKDITDLLKMIAGFAIVAAVFWSIGGLIGFVWRTIEGR